MVSFEGRGWFYFEFLSDYFVLREFSLLILFNIHSHQFFFVYCRVVQVLDGVLFMFLGTDVYLVNCFWTIRVDLKRAGFGGTCAG